MNLQEFSQVVLKVFGNGKDFEDVSISESCHYGDNSSGYNHWSVFKAIVMVDDTPVKVCIYYPGSGIQCIILGGEDIRHEVRYLSRTRYKDTEMALRCLHCDLHFNYRQVKTIKFPDGTFSEPIWGTSHLDIKSKIG